MAVQFEKIKQKTENLLLGCHNIEKLVITGNRRIQ